MTAGAAKPSNILNITGKPYLPTPLHQFRQIDVQAMALVLGLPV